jgi:hypothetical protein
MPHCVDNRLIDGGKVVSPHAPAALYSPETLLLFFLMFAVARRVLKRRTDQIFVAETRSTGGRDTFLSSEATVTITGVTFRGVTRNVATLPVKVGKPCLHGVTFRLPSPRVNRSCEKFTKNLSI